jgi:peptide chain release factor 1
MTEKSYAKKDFKIDWYSGSGAGGQHRNKTKNCCRITHIESGITAQSEDHRERTSNQRVAFQRLAKLIVAKFHTEAPTARHRVSEEVVRTYHGPRNEVLDKASGKRMEYREVVEKRNIGPMVEARLKALGNEEFDDD